MEHHTAGEAHKTFRVVIVGGGSSGWMTAAYLSRAFGCSVSIQLIESPTISTVGVGEATFSDLHLFFEFLGLQEEDWMQECNAAYKIAIRFEDWNAERRAFYHPFERLEIVNGRSIAEWWLKLQPAAFDRTCYVTSVVCDAQRSPRFLDGRVYDSKTEGHIGTTRSEKPLLLEDLQIQYPYAYHFDASLFAKYLCKYARQRGVIQLFDEVLEVQLSPAGAIQKLQTREHGAIEGDLFIDCTGFRGLLINQALNEPFISFLQSLPCDRAVAMQVPGNGAVEGMNPFTTATALSAGWAWNIPLYHRVGTGYVYSSACISADEAEKEFRAHLGERSEGCVAQHIRIRVGRNRNSWVKNCVAIGLSSGFVEPLESTGLFFIQHAIEQLVTHFPSNGYKEEAIQSYNRIIGECIDGVREFLTLHYVASSRYDTKFWKLTKHELTVLPDLSERLKLWKTRLPSRRTIRSGYHGFGVHNYCAMLMGLGWRPNRHLAVLDHIDNRDALQAFERIHHKAEGLTRALPSEYEYLRTQYTQTPVAQGVHV